MTSNRTKLAIFALFSGLLLIAGAALADSWPASVEGTWTVIGSNDEGSLVITQDAGTKSSLSKPIRGVIYKKDNIEGFYNPSSGRIFFARYRGKTIQVIQIWSGNLSQLITGKPYRIGGMLSVFKSGGLGGSLGEYNFSAVQTKK
jgi:hypothetical protein